jgi:hypothetical protein
MRRIAVFPAAAVALLLLASAPQRAFAGRLDDAVLAELNFVRAHPSDYARELRSETGEDDPRERYSSFAYEDPNALDDAIAFLERQSPLPPLRGDTRLASAAMAHASAQGPGGEVGHGGPGRSSLGQRLQRQGVWAGLAAEDISYGYEAPRDVVRQLVVDSGVASRGHRKNIFDPAFQAAGVGCGRHRVYGSMCVIDFAGALVVR